MKFGRTPSNSRWPAATERRRHGFTLVEVLATLLFMTIVIPVALQALDVASRAGEYGQRRLVAARIAQSKVDELVATGQWHFSAPSGTVEEGTRSYRWQATVDPWQDGVLNVITVHVTFTVRGRDYEVRMSSLVDPSLQ